MTAPDSPPTPAPGPVRLPPPGRDPLWLLYRALVVVLSPVWAALAAWHLVIRGSPEERAERLGGGRTLPPPPADPGTRAWFHGVSVGEVEALAPVIQACEAVAAEAGQEVEVVVSTTTVTGRARIDALYPHALERRFTPLDLPWTTARAMHRIRPSVLVLGESELWPALLQRAAARVPVVLVNGRISDQTLPRARRFRPLYRWMLRRIALAGVQSDEDASRLVELGLDPARVRVTGNTKFDRTAPVLTPRERRGLREDLGVGERTLIVAGSTFPGEDELLLDALERLRTTSPHLHGPGSLGLLLAPRHPERGDAVVARIQARGLSVWRRSQGSVPPGQRPDVVLLDTVGELAGIYALARVAVVGRSFRVGGGQNPLEPMALGVPVVYGPRMENFRTIAHLAEAGGAAVRCANDAELLPTLERILTDPGTHATMAEAGPRILAAHRGASRRSAELILRATPGQAAPEGRPGRPGRPGRLGLLMMILVACAACTGSPPANPGSLQDGLAPCPDTPNCAEDAPPFVLSEQFRAAPAAERLDELVRIVEGQPRIRVVDREADEGPDGGLYLRAEATSRVFRFVDDLELRHATGSDRLEVRSASRLGQSDLGVNRSRVETLRGLLEEAGLLQP